MKTISEEYREALLQSIALYQIDVGGRMSYERANDVLALKNIIQPSPEKDYKNSRELTVKVKEYIGKMKVGFCLFGREKWRLSLKKNKSKLIKRLENVFRNFPETELLKLEINYLKNVINEVNGANIHDLLESIHELSQLLENASIDLEREISEKELLDIELTDMRSTNKKLLDDMKCALLTQSSLQQKVSDLLEENRQFRQDNERLNTRVDKLAHAISLLEEKVGHQNRPA